MPRTILHCDMNNFYASVECMLDPELRDKCIAVGGDVEERHGIILAKNYKAKAFGVQTGEALWQARQKCPGLIIVPPHYEEYLKYSRLARSIYEEYTDQVESYGMDECWLDVTGSTKIFGDGEKIANEIRERMKFELGLTISAGVSFNKVFAKLGSDMKKPDAVTVIPADSFRSIIWDLPTSDLLGVGRATQKKLDRFGVKTIGQLAQMPESWAVSQMGKHGAMLLRFANGLDTSVVAHQDFSPPFKSVGHGLTAREDLENAGEVWNMMLMLSQDIGHRLRKYRRNATGVAIDIRDSELQFKQWQCKLPVYTHSAAIISKKAFELFQFHYTWEHPIRSVTVRAINLCGWDEPQQLDFYTSAEAIDKKERLETVVDQLRGRFGKYAIMPACLAQDIKKPSDREIKLTMPTGMIM